MSQQNTPTDTQKVESLAAKFYEIYQQEVKRQNNVRHADSYESLPEYIKEFYRVLARDVLAYEKEVVEQAEAVIVEKCLEDQVFITDLLGDKKETILCLCGYSVSLPDIQAAWKARNEHIRTLFPAPHFIEIRELEAKLNEAQWWHTTGPITDFNCKVGRIIYYQNRIEALKNESKEKS